jgi:hypothetical protein
MKRLYNSALFYAVLGLLLGVFYREFTKAKDFTGVSMLGSLHVHALALGMLFFLLLLVFDNNFSLTAYKRFNLWFVVYNLGLMGTLGAMSVRGVIQVLGQEMNGLNYIAGTFHMILGIGMVWFMFILRNRIWDKAKINAK